MGDESHEAVALEEIRSLDPGDLPFALHFLVPFKSAKVKAYLLDLLNGAKTTTCEVLPLLGRQEPDEDVLDPTPQAVDVAKVKRRSSALWPPPTDPERPQALLGELNGAPLLVRPG